MSSIERFASVEEFQHAPTLPHWPAVTGAEYARQQTDLHLVKVDAGKPSARCSIWWHNTPPHEKEKLGVIGHYAAESRAANDTLLDEALKILKEKGCTLVVGPMDGNTWNKYRWITWSNGHPPFFMEMQNPAEWPEYFTAYGLKPLLVDQTRVVNDITDIQVQSTDLLERVAKSGLAIRTLDMDRAKQELEAVYDVSARSFAEAPLYMPQEKSAFVQQYMSLLPQIDPDWVTLIEDGNRLVGYQFAIPDWTQKKRGEKVDTLIPKTTAILPDAHGKGIGKILSDWFHHKAREKGFKKIIHSFMHDDNTTKRMSAHFNSELIRRYTLFSKSL